MKYNQLLISKDAETARKALDYLDGKQEQWVKKALDNQYGGRKDWKNRGMLPRHRNITKMIIEKSGLLFNEAPRLAIYNGDVVNDKATGQIMDLFEGADWVEFFTNLDSVVRLLKTALVLVQSGPDNQLILDCLHKGNSYVGYDYITRQVNLLVYKVCEPDEDGNSKIRVITPVDIQDYDVDKEGEEVLTASMPNPYGIIPVAVFNDTNIPRTGFWNFIPNDLVQMNEIYNFHLIDSEYAASWSKLKTLFTNAQINADSNMSMEPVFFEGQVLPRMAPTEVGLVGGPGAIITLETAGGAQPYAQYLGPDINLDPIDNMIARWVKDFAADWSVNVKTVGTGKANSGFQLVVEESDNLQLRRKRSQMFVTGFKRLFKVLKPVFGLEGDDLFVTFAPPRLPVDEQANEQTWDLRIAGGRASVVSYFMDEDGLTREEAINKAMQIKEENAMFAPGTAVVAQVGEDAEADAANGDGPLDTGSGAGCEIEDKENDTNGLLSGMPQAVIIASPEDLTDLGPFV